MNNISFAAFVMTYERPEILLKTISEILKQTLPPKKVLVVDNSLSDITKTSINNLKDNRVEYISTGHNAGPAGAAKLGLERLCDEGFEWIYWGDDDDPPKASNTFECIFKNILLLQEQNPTIKLGIFGQIGGFFNKYTVRMRNLYNRELKGLVEVDQIAGGKTMIVNSRVVKEGVLPNPKLFFGFEELDFCLRVKKAGFLIMLDGDSWLRARYKANKTDPNYKWRGTSIGKMDGLWRQYYSSRNMLDILLKNGFYIGILFFLMKLVVKSVYGFKYGKGYGVKNFKIQWLAMGHFFSGKYYKTDLSVI